MSYHSDCKQLVDVSAFNVSCGVPQREILEPLLFLIYVNAMSGVHDDKMSFVC